MLLIAYDGSDNAKAAIAAVARLMPGADAMVLMTWEPYIDSLARSGAMGLGGVSSTISPEIEDQLRAGSLKIATEGAELAAAAGLVATHKAVPTNGSPAHAILGEADALGADLIVVGTRGLGRVKSVVLGSVSHAVVQHADRPVMVIPAPQAKH
jgi:nucleotide-binding universal stress UspA family protein